MISMSNKYRIILIYYKNLNKLEEVATKLNLPLHKLSIFASGKNMLTRSEFDNLKANIDLVITDNIPGLVDSNEITQ